MPPHTSADRADLDEALFADGPVAADPPLPDDLVTAVRAAEPAAARSPTHVLINDVTPPINPGPESPPLDSPAAPPPAALARNAGLAVAPGDAAAITPEHLRLTGGGGPHLIDLMLLSPPLAGAVLRDGFALTGGDVFTQEDIDHGRVSYRHDGGDEAEDAFTFATPDGAVPPTVFAIAIPRRRAPLLLGPGQLAQALGGCRAADVLDGLARPCDGAPAGLAVVAAQGVGEWHYSLGGAWLDLADVRHGHALLLGPDDLLRFTPRPGWSGAARLSYRAWDQSDGARGGRADLSSRGHVGGATAFSQSVMTAELLVEAPAEALPPTAAEPWAGCPSAAELAGGGLAVVRLVGEGAWQYSLDGGASWRDFGPVYHGRARLLRGGDRVRFLPRAGWSGRVALAGRAWDGRGEAGGAANLASRPACGDGTPFGAAVLTRAWYRVA